MTTRCKETSKECVWGQISPGSFPEHKVLGNKAKISSLLVCATDTVACFDAKSFSTLLTLQVMIAVEEGWKQGYTLPPLSPAQPIHHTFQ